MNIDDYPAEPEDDTRAHAYADNDGDLWVFIEGQWRYLCSDARFNLLDADSNDSEALPKDLGPFTELSTDTAEALRRFYNIRKNLR